MHGPGVVGGGRAILLTDQEGNIVLSRGRVCDFYELHYWRVIEVSDNDLEAFNRRRL